jgi:hypothetical protein
MMNRFNSPSLPTAASFFGRQTSEDNFEPPSNEKRSAPVRKPSFGYGRSQAMEKPPPARGLGFRDLMPSRSWNKRFGDIQRSNSNSFFGPRVDNESKDVQPRLRATRSNSQSSNLKPPPPYAIDVTPVPQSFAVPIANPTRATRPPQNMYFPEAVPMLPHVATATLKKPPPGSMEAAQMSRVPPTISPLSGRYGSRVATSNQGYAPESRRQLMQKQNSFRRDVSVVEQRPQKPHRQDSRSVIHQQGYSHPPRGEGFCRQQEPYNQFYDSLGRQTERQPQGVCSFVPGNGQLSPSRSWTTNHSNTSTLQDDLYNKASYKNNFNYSSIKKLKPPPPSALPGASSPASSSLRSSKTPILIEIYPGASQILRGAEETSQAADRNFVVMCQCIACESRHLCIANAAYVLCPECKSISLVESNKTHVNGIDTSKPYGLGLGFVPENNAGVAAAPGLPESQQSPYY